MQFLGALRTSLAGQIGTYIGTGGTLKTYTGAPPGVANAATGTLLSTQTGVTFAAGGSAGQETITTTADASAAASGTPGYCRILNSGGTAEIEGTAGIGTAAVLGAVTVTSGAITAVALTSGGSGYGANVTYNIPILNPTGGDGYGAIVQAVSNASGVLQTPTVVYGGVNYPATGVTAFCPQPFDFMFNQAVSLGGNVSVSSASITIGNQ